MQEDQILQAYAKRKAIRLYSWVGAVVAEIAWLAAFHRLLPQLLLHGGALLFGALLLYIHWRYWRCPVCERSLGRGFDTHCPKCGTQLVA